MSIVDYIQANTDGRLHDAREPSVSALNRGYLYGDAIYEVWRTYDGVVFAWEDHGKRLKQSAVALYFPALPDETFWWAEISKTVAAFRSHSAWAGDIYIRLQIARGEGPIGLDPALADKISYVILVKPVPVMPAAQQQHGMRLSVATTLRRNAVETLNPAWKTGNYLNNILCLREARARGADEVLMTNLAGEITEAAVCNVAFVRDGEVITPPLSAGMLEGITRRRLLDAVAPAVGVRTREAALRPEDLGSMQECFLLSTTKDVQPVSAIDGHTYAVGAGTVGAQLKAAFQQHAAAYTAAHPELKL